MKKHFKKLITMLLVIAMLIPTVAMIYSSAAITNYSVELAFNNIFVFDKWANNTLSTTMVSGGAPVEDELDIDIDNGSFTFTNPYEGEAYTGHGMGTGAINSAGNFQYYMMDVEPGAAYTFSYNVTSLTSDLVFSPYVFYFDENGSYLTLANHSIASTGEASFVFFAPSNAHYIQVRFTLSGTGSVAAEDIAIRMTDISSYGANIFDFDSWAGNTNSGKVSETAAYSGGTIAKDTTNNAVTLTTDGNTTYLFTGHTFGSDGNNYYMIPVEAGATYNFSYNLSSCNFAPANYTPYILYCDSTGTYKSPLTISATNTGSNKFVFTVPAGISYIQIVYGISNAKSGYTCTVKDLAIQKITLSTADTNAGVPHRRVYTYKGDNATTYGALPVPSYAPNGYVFAGWYTGPNGTGELITENTLVDCTSYTVYSKYEPIVNSITIKTLPVKTSYTVGERVNPTGLVLEATVANLTTTIESGYRCTPEYLTATGTQTITVHYGGKTATYTVEVSASASKSVVVNSSTVDVSVTNNVYTFASVVNTGEFNRYMITYNSDAYFEGIITYSDGETEQFFLEPSSNFGENETPKFTSFIDGYLEKVINGAGQTTAINSHTRSGIKSIAFTPLDNKAGSIDLLSITTSKATQITNAADTLKSFSDDRFEVVIDILNGGVVSGLYALNSDVVARVYEHKDTEGNITYETKVDYKENLSDVGYDSESENTKVNLINTYDTGRYLQQSYYGTSEKPYETGYYNRADWNYNPVQGGNVANEASKVIDYEIGDDYIYVKARPLDWAKWSDDHAGKCTHETEDHTEACWGEEYITDTYVEAKYVFEDGIIKTYCRMVDYSGYPSAQTTQELPAFYTIEPLNNFVYNDVAEDEAWIIQNFEYKESPEFWGVSQEYKNAHYPNNSFDANADVAEHWAAFMASESSSSFGIGLYTPETTNFYYGCYPSIYSETINSDGTFEQTDTLNYRHAETINPATEDDSSYIAPIGVKTFESYKPTEYMYALTTGTVDDIQDTFGLIYDERYKSELNRTQIAVPETIYMTPSATTSTTAEYYVNNIIDSNGNVSLQKSNNDTTGYVAIYSPGMTGFRYDVSINGDDSAIKFGFENMDLTTEAMVNQGCGDVKGYIFYDGVNLQSLTSGIAAGSTATAEWKFTLTYADGSTSTHYAYTTLYSPWLEPVGAAIRSKTQGEQVFGQAAAWVSGVHGYTANSSGTYKVAVTDQTLNNDGSFVGDYYAKTSSYALVPLLYGIGTPSDTTTGIDNFIQNTSPGGGITSATIRYTNREAKNTMFDKDYGILISDISPVANITVDTSRYTNFNQIPNLTVGYNITDTENSVAAKWYVSDLTDIVNSATDATSHEVKFYNYTQSDSSDNVSNAAKNEWFNNKAVGNRIYGSDTEDSNGTNYNKVSSTEEWNAAWDRQIITGSETYDYMFKGACHAHHNSDARSYIMNHVQLRATNVNKANLRDLVLLASGLDESNYTEESWSALKTALRAAAIELGNPTDSDISAAEEELKDKLMALQTPVTLKANGGSFSGGATETTVNLTCGPRLTPYYTISVENNPTLAGYSVEGWSTDKTATEGTNPVMGGLKPTFYAIWTEGSYTIIYNANGGSGYIADVTLKHSESVELATLGFTRDGYSLVGWSKSASATSPEYLLGETVSGLSNNTATTVTLYAVWTENKYTVIYNANGGSGSIASQTVNGSENFALASSGFTKGGHILLGWATNASASTPEYQLGQTVSKLAAGGTITLYAVWRTADFLVEDIVVVDFATPVTFSPIDNDTELENLVSTGGTYSIIGISTDGANYASTASGNYGSFALSGDNVTYTPSKAVDSIDKIYYHVAITYGGSSTTINEAISVVPASTVLYEEDKFVVTNTTGLAWTNATSDYYAVQPDSPSKEVYGYDSSYNAYANFSNGSAKTVTVDSKNKRSNILSFTFTGTGFNLYGACGANTGVQLITIKNNTTGKMVKSIVIDTYYGDAAYGTLYQVPIVSENNLDYASYTVQVMASYLPTMSGALNAQSVATDGAMTVYNASVNEALAEALSEIGMEHILNADEVSVVWFDEDSILNGGKGVDTQKDGTVATAAVTELYNVVDAIRIYTPAENVDEYYIDSEKLPLYYNIMDNLINGGAVSGTGNFAYVSGNPNEAISPDTYDAIGSKDELYLAGTTKAVAFKIDGFIPDSSKVMISLRAAHVTSSAKPAAKVGSGQMTITSNTEMYYDITDYVADDGTVTIQNTTEGTLLAVGYVKLVGETVNLASTFNLESARLMMAAPAEEVDFNAPKVEPDVSEPEDGTDADDSTNDNTEDCWFITLLKKIYNFFVKAYNFGKNIFTKVFSLFSY